MDHEFHDERARNASGAAASLPPRGQFQRARAGGGGGAFNRFKQRGDTGGAPRDRPFRDGPRPAYRDSARPRSEGNRDGPRPSGARPRGPSSGGRSSGGSGPRRGPPRH